MSLSHLKSRFDQVFNAINGGSIMGFSTSAENGFEALTLATVMAEYKNAYGNILKLDSPTDPKFLNQKPGKFWIERSFRIDFQSGESFYFSADVEVYGLRALEEGNPAGTLFEVDVIVIPTSVSNEVISNFDRYPAPQHIHSAYECKFGKYNKSQLRELLGLKRHLSFIGSHTPFQDLPKPLFQTTVTNSHPPIALKMARPRRQIFFDFQTQRMLDLQQIIVT